MAGFSNGTCNCANFNTKEIPHDHGPTILADGQLLIGSAVAPNVRVGTLTPGAGVTITNGPGTITVGLTGGGASIQTFTTDSGAPAVVPTVGNVNILGTLGISVTGNGPGSTVTISGTGGGLTWTRIAGAAQALAVQNGYIPTNAALTTCTLPATAALGAIIKIDGEGTGLFRVATQAGQQIHVGVLSSTVGVGGFVTATNRRDCITLRCTVANNEWIAECFVGNFGVT